MNISIIVLNIFVLWNLTTFVIMGIDKFKAIKGLKRISEKTLFLSAFLVGGIGVMCGMAVFRHKTKHLSFKILVPIAVVINGVAMYYAFRMLS